MKSNTAHEVGEASQTRWTVTSPWLRLVVGKYPKRTLLRALLLGIALWLVTKHLLLPVRISGISMEPAYRHGSFNVVNRLPYFFRVPRRGEVVAIKTTGPHLLYFKRIVGLPGETVTIRKGAVWIDQRLLPEPYVKARAAWEVKPRKLGTNEYFVIGDNRAMDQDAHLFGAVNRRKIVGKALR
jgi:signal peptidase I